MTQDPHFLRFHRDFGCPPQASLDDTVNTCRDRLQTILAQDGVCLLRDFPVADAADFQQFISGLGFDLDDKYEGGAAPRTRIASAVFNSTDAAPSMIIGYHNEQCYQTSRPAMIAFFCKTAPESCGETPLIDSARVFELLPAELQDALAEHGVQYRRYFPATTEQYNFRKTWSLAFGTEDRSVVEQILGEADTRYEWQTDGSLSTSIVTPGVVPDPASGRPCLCINMYEEFTWAYVFERFKERYGRSERRRLVKLMEQQTADPHPFLQTRLGNGRPFTQAESIAIHKAAWDIAEIFTWAPADLLLINNVRYAHARLNVTGPRQIYAALAAPYNVHRPETNIFTAHAPAKVREAVLEPAA